MLGDNLALKTFSQIETTVSNKIVYKNNITQK